MFKAALGSAAMVLCALPAAVHCAEINLYMMTMPPLVMDADGRRGMVGDVVLEAMRRAGLPARILVEPNPRAMAAVQDGRDHFIIALARTPGREHLYTWIAPIIAVHRTFYTMGRKVGSFAEARAAYRHIAVSRNTANEEVLLNEGFAPGQLVPVNAGEAAPRMLLAGRVDAWFNLIPESETLLRQVGGTARVQAGERLASSDLYLACSLQCDPALVQKLTAALVAMRADGSTRRLLQRYAMEPGFALD